MCKFWWNTPNLHIFFCIGGIIMRIISDTTKGRIILPKSFFTELDKKNKDLEEAGSDKKWAPEEWVRSQFEKAMKENMLRPGDKVVN